jgi:hypothetical protein
MFFTLWTLYRFYYKGISTNIARVQRQVLLTVPNVVVEKL